jgi:hypothetical protein
MGNRRHGREEMLGISAPDHCNIRDVLSSGQRFSHKLQFGPRAADLKGTCNEKVCNIHRGLFLQALQVACANYFLDIRLRAFHLMWWPSQFSKTVLAGRSTS